MLDDKNMFIHSKITLATPIKVLSQRQEHYKAKQKHKTLLV